MSLVVNHNLMAMNAARNLQTVYKRLATSTQRLSSGMRINSAGDDAAGLAIRELMRADIAVLLQGVRNAADAISMIQTAEGAMSVIDEKLVRMKELAEQSATGTYTTAQREILNSEYQAMAAEIDRIANATDFNGVKLLDGTLSYEHEGSGLKIHFGTGNDASEDYYFLEISDMRATRTSGLQVGNSDIQDVVRTNSLDVKDPDAKIEETAAAGGDGFFGIRYSTDYDSENPDDATWEIFGYVEVDQSQDTLNSIASRINKGRAASGTIEAHTMTSSEIRTQTLTVNGQVLSFATGGASSYDSDLGTGTVNLNNAGSAASVAADVAAFFNDYHSDIGVVATRNNTTMNVWALDPGSDGNSINTVSNSTAGFTAHQTVLEDGGSSDIAAAAYLDPIHDEYELQLSMNQGGEKFQIQVFNMSSTPEIVAGAISGTSVSSSAALLDGNVASYGDVDETSEWTLAQEANGRTEWDGADVLTQSAAQAALAALDDAIHRKDSGRAQLGSIQNRLENTITNLQIQAENLQASESRISDVDVASEMTEFTRNNILAQAATSMLAQANSLPTLALSLLA